MRPFKIAIVAGEPSGDRLAAGMIAALLKSGTPMEIYGVTGPLMEQAGAKRWYSIERLSVMGFGEVLKQLIPIIRFRKLLIKRLVADPPDLFIGVDSIDFNSKIERILKARGVPVVHYNSPKIWAWRENRLGQIKKCVDHMLCLFPFEVALYRKQGMQATFVGHPLADRIPITVDKKSALQRLALDEKAKIIAILPGSRHSEIKKMAPIFLQAAKLIVQQNHRVQFVTSMVNQNRKQEFLAILQKTAPELPIKIVEFDSGVVLSAADCALCAAGTVTLEALLYKVPMVVAYVIAPVTDFILKRRYRLPYVGLPNIIANQPLTPEFVWEKVNPLNLANAVVNQLMTDQQAVLNKEFKKIHVQLRQEADKKSAQVVLRMLHKQKDFHNEYPAH